MQKSNTRQAILLPGQADPFSLTSRTTGSQAVTWLDSNTTAMHDTADHLTSRPSASALA